MGLQRKFRKQVRFGFEKGLPKPRTRESWLALYSEHRRYLYNIKKVTVEWSKKGKGHSGTRRFHQLKVQPLKYWNPDIEIHEIKYTYIPEPKITVELTSGETKVIETKNMLADDIFKEIELAGGVLPQ